VSGISLVLTLVTLLWVPAVQAQAEDVQAGPDVVPMVFTLEAQVDAIQQCTSFNGVIWVRLVGVSCSGSGMGGWFTFAHSNIQPLLLEILLAALDRGFRVSINHNPSNCRATDVGVCATGSPC
jgi:hypothetical protein